jgi:hypothetical protein
LGKGPTMKALLTLGASIILLALGLFIGCGDEKPSGPILGDFAYPLQVGQVWKYSGRQYNFNFVPESLATNYSTLHNYTSAVQVMQKTKILDTLDVYSIRELAVQIGVGSYETWHYYNNRSDGLYNYAYGGTSAMMLPRKLAPATTRLIFRGRPLEETERQLGVSLLSPSGLAPQSDSLTSIEDPPFRSLVYPLSYGSEWPVRVPPKLSPINKKVIEKVQIQVPAGIFTCAKIQWLYDIDEDGGWDTDLEQYDFISQIGLVKRTRLYRGVAVTTHEYPAGVGVCDIAESWELTQTIGGQ